MGKILHLGMNVRHPRFGLGSVRAIEGHGDQQKVTVFFHSGVPRKLMVKFANLEFGDATPKEAEYAAAAKAAALQVGRNTDREEGSPAADAPPIAETDVTVDPAGEVVELNEEVSIEEEVIVRRNSDVSTEFDLLLFDLDNTLIQSDNLENLRGTKYVNDESREYIENILDVSSEVKKIIDEEVILELRKEFPRLRLGVLTRAPKTYTNVLLEHLYSKISWDCIIAYEDVEKRKPDPDGILLAAQLAQVEDRGRIAYVGDESIDVVAAYQAGAYAVLYKGGWGDMSYRYDKKNTKRIDHNKADELIPDAIVEQPQELINLINKPWAFIPALECWDKGKGSDLPRRRSKVDMVPHFNNLPEVERPNWVFTQVLGRYFATQRSGISKYNYAHKIHSHQVTARILAAKDGHDYPDEWIGCCSHYMLHLPRNLDIPSMETMPLVVCPIPARSGRPPRMERFVDRLRAKTEERGDIFFNTKVLEFKEGATSNKQLSKDDRYKNIRDHLFVADPGAVVGKDVLVIDDVTTSGATFFYADRYIKAAGASSVRCLTLAHTIS